MIPYQHVMEAEGGRARQQQQPMCDGVSYRTLFALCFISSFCTAFYSRSYFSSLYVPI